MKNLFFKSNDALSDVRVYGTNVYLYRGESEYHHATVDGLTAEAIENIYHAEGLTDEQKINVCRALYAKEDFVSKSTDSEYLRYRVGNGPWDLVEVKNLLRNGQKIHAIKELRRMYVPMLGLKEAKELVEAMES